MNQSIIMPYHRNKDMLKYTIAQLDKFIDRDVEIIIVGNNTDAKELDVDLPSRVNYVKIPRSMLYSETVNMGVDMAKGEIITLCDQDIFSFSNWYVPLICAALKQLGVVANLCREGVELILAVA